MINDFEHLFMCLITNCIASFQKHLFKSFAHLNNIFIYFIYLASVGLGCNLQDHAESLVAAACELLVAA